MLKLYVAGLLVAAGLIIAFSQVFRDTPSVPVFLGGVLLTILAAIAFSDSKAKDLR